MLKAEINACRDVYSLRELYRKNYPQKPPYLMEKWITKVIKARELKQ